MTEGSLARRAVLVAVGVLACAALIAVFTFEFALRRPPTLNAQQQASGPVVHLETVGAVSDALVFPRPGDPHPDWVSYLPTTVLHVPAHSTVTMVIDQDDSPSGLRNPLWGKAQGIVGGQFHMKYYDDQGKAQEGDFSTIDPESAAHTFAIPDLGVFVPLLGLPDKVPDGALNTITFQFKTGEPGVYHWQCFVPCGAGTVLGNGGPMQTFGYMAGLLVVG